MLYRHPGRSQGSLVNWHLHDVAPDNCLLTQNFVLSNYLFLDHKIMLLALGIANVMNVIVSSRCRGAKKKNQAQEYKDKMITTICIFMLLIDP